MQLDKGDTDGKLFVRFISWQYVLMIIKMALENNIHYRWYLGWYWVISEFSPFHLIIVYSLTIRESWISFINRFFCVDVLFSFKFQSNKCRDVVTIWLHNLCAISHTNSGKLFCMKRFSFYFCEYSLFVSLSLFTVQRYSEEICRSVHTERLRHRSKHYVDKQNGYATHSVHRSVRQKL